MSVLEALATDIRACRICRDAPAGPVLPHAPRPVLRVSVTARLLIAGQAPGTRVHASGLAFDDRSGDRLRLWMGVAKEAFYDVSRIAIVPMGFCFPGQDAKGGDLPPRRECRAHWHDRLFASLPQVETILAIGRYAQIYHSGRLDRLYDAKAPLAEAVRASIGPTNAAPKIICLPHPSWRNTGWLKANPWFETDVLPVVRAEVARLVNPAE